MGVFYDQVGRENILKPIVSKKVYTKKATIMAMTLISRCTNKGLVKSSSTQFPRKYIYKYTWIAPVGQYKCQIRYVVVIKCLNLV